MGVTHTGFDPLHLAQVFGISEQAAIRYAVNAQHLRRGKRRRAVRRSGMEVTADDLGGLLHAATAAHRRMQASASRMTDDDCRGPSLLPGWSRGHVLTHWARNADGQSRMLLAAMQGEIAEQYPGGDERRESDIEAGAARTAKLILSDVRTAIDQVEDVWRRMPADAWSRPTAARIGTRPAWMSVWARWRETEIHHVDLDTGYTHSRWPAEFVDLMLPRVMPTLATRLNEEITVQVETIDRDPPDGHGHDCERDRGPGDRPRVRVGHLVLAPRTRLRRCGRPGRDPLRATLATAPAAGMGVRATANCHAVARPASSTPDWRVVRSAPSSPATPPATWQNRASAHSMPGHP